MKTPSLADLLRLNTRAWPWAHYAPTKLTSALQRLQHDPQIMTGKLYAMNAAFSELLPNARPDAFYAAFIVTVELLQGQALFSPPLAQLFLFKERCQNFPAPCPEPLKSLFERASKRLDGLTFLSLLTRDLSEREFIEQLALTSSKPPTWTVIESHLSIHLRGSQPRVPSLQCPHCKNRISP